MTVPVKDPTVKPPVAPAIPGKDGATAEELFDEAKRPPLVPGIDELKAPIPEPALRDGALRRK